MNVRVLVIDINPEFVNSLRFPMEKEGYDLEIALTVKTGLDILKERRIDVLILGLDQIEIPGLQVLDEIIDLGGKLPTVIGTSIENLGKKVINDISKKIHFSFLKKPVSTSRVMVEVKRLLKEKEKKKLARVEKY